MPSHSSTTTETNVFDETFVPTKGGMKDRMTKKLIQDRRIKKVPHRLLSRKQTPIREFRENISKLSKTLQSCVGIFSMTKQHNTLADVNHVLELVRTVRRLVCWEVDPPLHEVVNANLVPYLFKILYMGLILEYKNVATEDGVSTTLLSVWYSLVFESSWILTNIASGAFTQTVVEYKDPSITSMSAVQVLLMLLHLDSLDIQQQTLWNIANITGDNTTYRDVVLYSKVPDSILGIREYFNCLKEIDPANSTTKEIGSAQLIQDIYYRYKSNNVSIIRTLSWTFSNFLRGKPVSIDPENGSIVSKVLIDMVTTSRDTEALSDALWGVTYGTDTTTLEYINLFFNQELLRQLVKNISESTDINIQLPSLKTLGNFIRLDDHSMTQAIIEKPNFFEGLLSCSNNYKFSMRKESLYIMSNIAAGTVDQIKFLLSHDIFDRIVLPVLNVPPGDKESYSIKKEAIWIASNVGCSDSWKAVIDSPQLIEAVVKFYCGEETDSVIRQQAVVNLFQFLFSNLDDNGRKSLLERVKNMEAVLTHEENEILRELIITLSSLLE